MAFDDFKQADFLEILVEQGVIDHAASQRTLVASTSSGASVERILLELGLIDEEGLYQALAKFLQLPFIALGDFTPDLPARLNLSADFLRRTEALPASEDARGLLIATADPRGADVVRSIGYHLKTAVRPAIATPSAIKAVLGLIARPEREDPTEVSAGDIERLKALSNDGPVIAMVNDLIAKAVGQRASDVHIEAQETGARVRFRVDGTLFDAATIPEAQRQAVVSRLKIMANLNISERRRPQDGRAALAVRGRTVDIRLSSLPTQFGESIVLRLLDRNRMQLDWTALGFPAARAAQIAQIVSQPSGLFLVAGPTGSGKTTTLYTALSGINSNTRKIITVEDPVEYSLKGANQVQVEPAIDMTFARALRAILRQDPDVVMVGEIRDPETAEIAVRAALVGRMVLSTIHTNDCISTIDRLVDLGVPRYLLGATLRGVLSQRLVKRLCDGCGGAGCDACANTGRKGRIAVSELLTVTSDVAAAIAGRDGAVTPAARAAGFRTLAEEGRALIAMGGVDQLDLERVLGSE